MSRAVLKVKAGRACASGREKVGKFRPAMPLASYSTNLKRLLSLKLSR
jgi:hypothetical protein